jgi:hypothetical protein
MNEAKIRSKRNEKKGREQPCFARSSTTAVDGKRRDGWGKEDEGVQVYIGGRGRFGEYDWKGWVGGVWWWRERVGDREITLGRHHCGGGKRGE